MKPWEADVLYCDNDDFTSEDPKVGRRTDCFACYVSEYEGNNELGVDWYYTRSAEDCPTVTCFTGIEDVQQHGPCHYETCTDCIGEVYDAQSCQTTNFGYPWECDVLYCDNDDMNDGVGRRTDCFACYTVEEEDGWHYVRDAEDCDKVTCFSGIEDKE